MRNTKKHVVTFAHGPWQLQRRHHWFAGLLNTNSALEEYTIRYLNQENIIIIGPAPPRHPPSAPRPAQMNCAALCNEIVDWTRYRKPSAATRGRPRDSAASAASAAAVIDRRRAVIDEWLRVTDARAGAFGSRRWTSIARLASFAIAWPLRSTVRSVLRADTINIDHINARHRLSLIGGFHPASSASPPLVLLEALVLLRRSSTSRKALTMVVNNTTAVSKEGIEHLIEGGRSDGGIKGEEGRMDHWNSNSLDETQQQNLLRHVCILCKCGLLPCSIYPYHLCEDVITTQYVWSVFRVAYSNFDVREQLKDDGMTTVKIDISGPLTPLLTLPSLTARSPFFTYPIPIQETGYAPVTPLLMRVSMGGGDYPIFDDKASAGRPGPRPVISRAEIMRRAAGISAARPAATHVSALITISRRRAVMR
ncbi:hypothetical protein EVAR_35776_1 [Eumeta japonica]|uniref:Uncharacterized protein n=1 Tax=Eumeta variegata TaxID=151549 RepID=A0A4C1WR58_EUMVA|nr:hypothetical protein EVAR_35776_1 [Eumeta japonica]